MADRELDAQVERFDRRVNPRSRDEIDAAIEQERARSAPIVERYNTLLERQARVRAELGRLAPIVRSYEGRAYDLTEESKERAQLDGVLPSLPQVMRPGLVDHKSDDEEGEEDDGGNDCDFEVGSKG